MTSLEARLLKKNFPLRHGQLEVLKGIDFEIQNQERVALLGRSGSGKSTLISILAGLDEPSAGELLLNGKSFFEIPLDERNKIRAERLGIIFQQFYLMPQLTAFENIRLPLDLRSDSEADKKAAELLEAVGLSSRSDHFPNELSRGECQRVAIARTLTLPIQILLADEPTASLDNRTADEIIALLFKLQNERGFALLVSTHDLDLATKFERSFRIQDGYLETYQLKQGISS